MNMLLEQVQYNLGHKFSLLQGMLLVLATLPVNSYKIGISY